MTEISEEQNKDGLEDKIQIFSNADERLKFLGELLSNESSRKILILITNHEMSANEIVEKTNLRLSLIIHHLNKMQKAGIVKISKVGKNSKNHDVRYYSARPGIMILPKNVSDRAKESKKFQTSIKQIFKFAAIGLTSLASWMILRPSDEISSGGHLQSGKITTDTMYILIPLLIIIAGLIIDRILTYKKTKEQF